MVGLAAVLAALAVGPVGATATAVGTATEEVAAMVATVAVILAVALVVVTVTDRVVQRARRRALHLRLMAATIEALLAVLDEQSVCTKCGTPAKAGPTMLNLSEFFLMDASGSKLEPGPKRLKSGSA